MKKDKYLYNDRYFKMGKSLTQNEFLLKAKNKHGNLYTYEKSKYIRSDEKIEISCKKHGPFWIKPSAFLQGRGCAKCANEKRAAINRKNASKQRMTKNDFLTKALKIHGDLYDYSLVDFKGIKHHIKIICAEHGVFTQMAQAHIYNKQGCPKCFKKQRLLSVTKNGNCDKTFIERANEIHDSCYNYNKTDLLKRDKKGRIVITCQKHGDFKIMPSAHISPIKKQGCPKCGYERTAKANKKRMLTNVEYIKRAIKKHGNRYDYSLVDYTGATTNINIICKKHGVFNQNPGDHLQGNGCQKCATFATSLMEQQWLEYMQVTEDKQQKWLIVSGKRIKVDGFDEKTNTVYEFFGDFWHGNINNPKFKPNNINPKNKKTYQQLYNDTTKRIDLIIQNGYNIEYIWEYDWIKIKDKINENKI